MSIYGIKQFSVCCYGDSFTTAAKSSISSVLLTASITKSFAHCINNQIFKALTILELFRIMLSKSRHYTPEPRFQTTDRET